MTNYNGLAAPEFNISGVLSSTDERQFARQMVQAHAYGMEMAMRVRTMDTEQLVDLGLNSLAALEEKRIINQNERFALADVFQAALISDDLTTHQDAIRRAREMMGECGAFAELIIGIAEDSSARAAGEDDATQLPPGAHARMASRARKVAAWLADTAAGSAAGVAAAPTVVGAIAIGAVVGAAASAAVLV